MFPNESSSDEISSKTNAFVQNCEEEGVAVSAALVVQRPLGSTFPTNQVPDLRDTNDCSAENDASMKSALCALNPCRSNTLHTGCEPCALPVEVGTEGGGAGPLTCPPASLLLSSVSVITSSTHRETLPPSHTTISGALQSPDDLFASHHHGSSSSNSLYCAQIQTFHYQNHSHITDSQASNATTSNHDNVATEMNHVKRLNTGALSVQDNNNNFVKINNNNKNNSNNDNNNNNNNNNKHSIKDGNSAKNRSLTPQNIPQSKPYSITTVQGNDVTQRSFKCDDYASRWGIPHACRLLGGGESSLSAGASGWTNTNNNNTNTAAWTSSGTNSNGQQQAPNSSNQTQPQQQSQWANSNNNNPAPNQRSAGNNTSPSSQQSSGNSGMKNSGNNVSGSGGPTAIQQQPPTSQQQTQQQPQQQSGNSNTNNQQQTQNGSGTWAQAAGKGLPPSNPPSSGSVSNTSTSNTTGTSTKQQLEQLNSMREALFSQDGWGGQHVNQDSGWDVPQSPEPGGKDSNGAPMAPVWKPTVNNGTDLWEANLRNGGQPPPQVAQKAPWGHTPTSNIGGTWGEDDDLGDSSNVWTGVPSGQSGGGGGQWGNNAGPQPMWGGPKKESDWTGVGSSSNWGDPRDIRSTAGSTMDPRDIRAGGDIRSAMVDHRDPMRSVMDHRGMVSGDVMMRGDPRGISGRLNGGAAGDPAMWGAPPQQPPHHHVPHHQQAQPPNKMVAPNAPGVNQWPGPPPKDMGMPVGGVAKPTGWEEPSPPAQRRNIPNYDDGTSLWGGQQRAAVQAPSKVSHWKEMPTANMGRGMQCPPGMPQNRMAANNMKPETPLWGHPARNGSWGEGPHEVGGAAPWGDDKVSGSGGLTPWNDPTLSSWSAAQKPKNTMNPSWVDGDVDPAWGHPPKQPPKPMTKEIIWSSKQFRILSDMGFKKEEVENALRLCAMSLEDALEYLNATRSTLGGSDAWRATRHSEMEPPFDHSNPPAFPAQRFNPPQMQFAPPVSGGGSGNAPNLLNNVANQNLNNLSPALVQKILQPPPQQPPSQQTAPYNQTSRNPQNQPSTQQLRMLVQQIQMAVQAGYLNHQILNQPLAPQTLILLNQLLQQIKLLQQLMQQQAMLQVQPLNKSNSNTVLHLSVQITKSKQQIHNLQNQIAAQQAIYVKQQQHQIAPQQGDFFKTNLPDPLSALQSNFSDLGINKEPQHTPAFQSQQQGSRLNQWKLPSLDKDGEMSGSNEFSRAPGTTTKPQGGSTSPNINPLLGQADGTWSSVGRSNSDTGWPDSSNVESDNKDWPVTTTQSSSQAFTDLVPEFEPGKPWKGNQMKSIEDDPSITPGSVVRSPLSLATIKDTEIFNSAGGGGGGSGGGGKSSPTGGGVVDMPIPPLSLSSTTWTFNPPASTASSFTSPLGKLSGSKSTWGEAPPPSVSSELWGVPKSRPPPGLSSKAAPTPTNGSASSSSNGWGSLGRWGPQTNPSSWNSSWLFLRNLTPQIDGSTLKTLCVQHGPLQNFHLYLNHGIALAKYSTRDEAIKAQGALNNCVLGNTTIFAESLGENDVQQLLQHLSQQSSGGGGWGLRGGATPNQGSGPKGAPPSDTWGSGSQLWAPANTGGSSLWTPLEPPSDQHRSTPSSLNSFLPGDLLGSSDPM